MADGHTRMVGAPTSVVSPTLELAFIAQSLRLSLALPTPIWVVEQPELGWYPSGDRPRPASHMPPPRQRDRFVYGQVPVAGAHVLARNLVTIDVSLGKR